MRNPAISEVTQAVLLACETPSSSNQTGTPSVTDQATSNQRKKTMAKKMKLTVAQRISVETIRRAVALVQSQEGVTHGVVFHTYSGSVSDLLKQNNFEHISIIVGLIQRIGLARHWRTGADSRTTTWQVVDNQLVDEYLKDVWVDRAIFNYDLHNTKVDERTALEKMVEELSDEVKRLKGEAIKTASPSDANGSDAPDPALMVEVARLLEDRDTLRASAATCELEVTRLRAELANKPKITNADIATYLAGCRNK